MEHPDWNGWRFAGRFLVSPDGDRMTPERLRGLCWRDQLELRRAGYNTRRQAERGTPAKALRSGRRVCMAAIVRLPARERFAGCA